MVEKLTVDRATGPAGLPGGAVAPAKRSIQLVQRPHLQPGPGAARPRLSASEARARGELAGIRHQAAAVAPAPAASAASPVRHRRSPYQVMEDFIERMNREGSRSAHAPPTDKAKNFPEEARKQATALMAESCDWKGALGLMQLMRANDITPSVINYGALMGVAKREFGPEQGAPKVLDAYDHMRREGVRPNLLICTTVITAMGRCGRTEDAEQVFRDMERRGDVADIKAFGALMSAYAAKAEDSGATVAQRLAAADATKRLYQELIGRGHGAQAHMLGPRMLSLASPLHPAAWPRSHL